MHPSDLKPLSPWLRYLLVGIIERHLFSERLALVCQTQLDPEEASGQLPGHPGWTYMDAFGGGWTVMHAESSQSFDVKPGRIERSEPVFWWSRLAAAAQGGDTSLPWVAAFRKAVDWLVGPTVTEAALKALLAEGYLAQTAGGAVGLTRGVADAVASFDSMSDHEELFADLLADPQEMEAARDAWREWLRGLVAQPGSNTLSEVHTEFEDEEVERMIWAQLQGNVAPPAAAFAVANAREIEIEPAIIDEMVDQLLEGDLRDSANAIVALAKYSLPLEISSEKVVEMLVRYARDVQNATFGIPEDASDDEVEQIWQHTEGMSLGVEQMEPVATMLLEHAPEQSITAIRRALRDDMGGVFLMATRLVAIGQTWAIREIERVIPEVTNPTVSNSLVALLRNTGHHDAATRAEATTKSAAQVVMGVELGDDFDLGELQQIVDAQMAEVSISPQMQEWAQRIRDGLPDDFDPS